MKLTSLQAASQSSPSSAVKPIRITQSIAARQLPLTASVVQEDVRTGSPDGASMGVDPSGWCEGAAVTCTSPSACAFSNTFRACCVDRACSSSASDIACLPSDDPVVLSGTQGPETSGRTDASSPACLTLFRATTLSAPDQMDSCVPISQVGQGSVVTTSTSQTPTLSSTQPSNSPPLLKPPAGTILEAILGVTVISVLVIISCIIVARKVHSARTVSPEADGSRSSLTLSALPGQEGRDATTPSSTQTGVELARRENKADRPRDGDGRG